MEQDKLIRVALWYKNQHGVSVIPCKDKRPTIKSWKEYQQTPMTDEEIKQHFAGAEQIATIAGIVSGGLEVIDFDIKYMPPIEREAFWRGFINDINEVNNNLLAKLQIHSTKSGGYHVLYRSEEIEGNKKLAKKLIDGKYEGIIETRGEGGYVIAPPSDGYSCIEDKFELHLISAEEREILLNICRSYNEEPEIKMESKRGATHNPQRSNFKTSPFEDYNQNGDIISFLVSQGWKAVQDQQDKIFLRRPGSENFQSANWHKSKRILYMFSSGDAHLEGGRGYNASQVYTLIACRGDYKEAYRKLRQDGYGKPWSDEEKDVIHSVRQSAGSDITKLKQKVIKEHPSWLTDDIDKIIETALQLDEDEFWFINDKGTLVINELSFNRFLHSTLGYALYDDDAAEEKPLIKISKHNHQVEIIRSNDIVKRDVEKWLTDNVDPDSGISVDSIMSLILRKDAKLFARAFYEWLPAIKFDTFNDTVEFSYFFFRNGIVKISAENITMTNYEDLPENTFIWKDRIRCHEFNIELLGDDDIFLDDKYTYWYIDKESKKKVSGHGSAWYKYIRRISGIGPEYDTVIFDNLPEEKFNRILSTMSIIGYLLHSFKDESRPWAVIINEDTPTDGKGGGSGKQIFTRGLSLLRNLKEEDGRQLNLNERFAFQGISEDHDIFVLDDVPKWFKLDKMYRMFTNDMVIEERNKGRKVIPFKKSPKFVFSTNYDITGTEEANHLKRRIKQLLFECYYGPENMPIHEIGMLLEAGWQKDDYQWQLFFNFMFQCVLTYLNRSIVEIDQTEKTKEKKIRNQFGDDFFDFMQSLISDEDDWVYEWWVVHPVWQHFKEKYDNRMPYKHFKENIVAFLKIYNVSYEIENRYSGKSSFVRDEEIGVDPKNYSKQYALKLTKIEK